MEEVRYFGRISLYALVVGVIYWFVSYEPAGTALLIGFGLATGGAFLVLRAGAPDAAATHDAAGARGANLSGDSAGADMLEDKAGGEASSRATPGADERRDVHADGPFADESGPVPTRSAAPLSVGFGIAAIALAGAFGPWFLIAGAVPLLLGAVDWLHAAEHELALRSSLDEPATSESGPGGRPADEHAGGGETAGDVEAKGASAPQAG